MSQPLVSVCIPAFNGEKYIVACIESVIHQTWRDLEIIVFDDGSKDATCDIVRKYMLMDSRIKLYINENNIGIVENWNQCVKLSSGEWIKFVCQDDYLDLSCISKMMQYASLPVQLITCDRKFIFEKN